MLQRRSCIFRKNNGHRRSIPASVLCGWLIAVASLSESRLCGAKPALLQSSPVSLLVFPARVRLFGPEASQRLVVVGVDADGTSRDLTREVTIESRTPDRVRVESDGAIRPVADGRAELIVRFTKSEVAVPVEVSRAARRGRSAFATRSCRS